MSSIVRNSEFLPLLEPERLAASTRLGRYMVVIYNNDVNTFDEVIGVLIQATGCDETEAAIEAWEAHTYGQAPVHFATQTECEVVAQIVTAVGVRAEVRKEWDE